MKKRIALLILSLLVCVCIYSFAISNAEDQTLFNEDFVYTILDDGTVSIVEYRGPYNVDVIIPSAIDGKEVSTLQTNIFPTNWIGNMPSVTVPATIVNMEGNPFGFCDINKIYISSDNPVFQSYDDAIYDMKDMRLVHLSSAKKNKKFTVMEGTKVIGEYALAGHDFVNEVILPNSVVEIGDYAFAIGNITSIVLPDSIKRIGKFAFYSNELTRINIPKSVETIEEGAFKHCFELKEIEIPEGIKKLEDGAFERCRDLKTVSLPDSLVEIDGNPFRECRSLETIRVSQDHNAFAVIDGVLFDKRDKRLIFYPISSERKSYSIPKGIKIIGRYAFAEAKLETVSIPDTVSEIGEYAFYEGRIESIVLPEGLTSIRDHTFYRCYIGSIKLPESLEYIGEWAFANIENTSPIITVNLPKNLKGIGESAFKYRRLNEINLPDNLQYIGYAAFSQSEVVNVKIPKSLIEIDGNPFESLEAIITLDKDNDQFVLEDGVLFTKDKKRLIYYPSKSSATEYIVPDGVEEIADGAFYGASKLISVIIPDSVKLIGNYAFYKCGIGSVSMSQNVRVIGACAFTSCKYLKKIELPETVVDIGKCAFQSTSCKITVYKDTYAADYCAMRANEDGFEFDYKSSTDWLDEYEPEEETADGAPTPRPTADLSQVRFYSVKDCYDTAVEYIKSTLKNPASLQIHSYTVTEDNDEYTFIFDYSAQNGFGGYNRKHYYVIVDHRLRLVTFAWSN